MSRIFSRILIATLLLFFLLTPLQDVQAQSTQASLRFYGHGVGGIDRVKIKIDAPARPVDVAEDFTIEFWMKASITQNDSPACESGGVTWIYGNTILDRDIFGDGDYGDYGISLAGGMIAFGVDNGSEALTICSATNVADEQWHHIALTRNANDGQMRIFVDGIQDAQGDGPTGDISYRDGRSTSYPNSDPFLVIGAEKHDAGSGFPSFSGWIDELRISNIVRYAGDFTPDAIPFISDANTVGLYHFDEAAYGPCKSTVIDSSGVGPSHGICRYGGAGQAGPVYSSDSPFPAAPGAPKSLIPSRNILLSNYRPLFDWSDSTPPARSNFDRYELQISTLLDFSNAEIFEIPGIENSFYTPANDLEDGQRFFWRVRAWNDAGMSSAWSTVQSFRTRMRPPVLLSPDDGTALTTRRPSFDWDDVNGATGYIIQVSRDVSFRRLAAKYVLRNPTSEFTPSSDLPANTILFWRVQAIGPNGPSLFSESRSFITGNPPSIPILLSPTSGALVNTYRPRLDWRDSYLPLGTTFDRYEVQISESPTFDSPLSADVFGLTTSEYTPDSDLAPNTTYYWRVRAWNTDGHVSAWSATRTLRIPFIPPPPPPIAGEWTQFAHDAQRTGYTEHVVPTPWRWKWAWNGPTSSGQIISGKFKLPRNSQPVTGGGRVYIAAGTRGVYALSEASGAVLWNRAPGGSINSTPAYDAETGALFVLSSNGTLYKLNAANGTTMGQFVTGASSNLPLPPAIAGERVFVSMGTRVYTINKFSLAQLWSYDAGSAVHTPPAYSPSRQRIIVVSQDLYVHAINDADGSQAWRIKPTVRNGGNPGTDNDSLAEVSNGWPVIAEEHGYVLVKLRLDWQSLWVSPSPWPTDNDAIRNFLQTQPAYQALFVLDLDDGSVPFIANIGHGGFGDGGYLPMGPQPVVKRFPNGQEVVYTVLRGDDGGDGRWDSHPGEMVLDDDTVPGLQAGYVRWIDHTNFSNGLTFFPTDEQPYVTMAGDYLFYAHWEAGAAYIITNRSESYGSFSTPIETALAPAIATSQDDTSCPFSASHYCSGGLQNTRGYPPGFYIYYRKGAVYDQYWSECASWVVSNDTVYFVSTDGAVVALQHGNPMAQTPYRQQANATWLDKTETTIPNLAVGSQVVPFEQAARYAGQYKTVEGRIQYIFNNGKAVYLGFKNPHQGAFKVRILKPYWSNFSAPPENLYHIGDLVQVRGMIEWYQGDPVIYVQSPHQIKRLTPVGSLFRLTD